MARPRSAVVDYLVYLMVRIGICAVQCLSFEMACRLARGLAWLVHRVDRRHRLVADDNLKHAFPGQYTDEQRAALVLEVYRHFCLMIMEILFLPRLVHATNWHQYMTMVGGPQLVSAFLSGRPVLLVTGHFGNWEIGNYLLGLFGWKTQVIARKLDNPYLNRWFLGVRMRTGQGVIDKNDPVDYERMLKLLGAGGVVATLGDQDAGQKGLFVDFFNRPASTHKAVALLALEFKTPMVILGVPRVGGPMHADTLAIDTIDPLDYQDRPDAVKAITIRFTEALERLICQYPEQYFWLHRRWKHAPPVRKAKKTAA